MTHVKETHVDKLRGEVNRLVLQLCDLDFTVSFKQARGILKTIDEIYIRLAEIEVFMEYKPGCKQIDETSEEEE